MTIHHQSVIFTHLLPLFLTATAVATATAIEALAENVMKTLADRAVAIDISSNVFTLILSF